MHDLSWPKALLLYGVVPAIIFIVGYCKGYRDGQTISYFGRRIR